MNYADVLEFIIKDVTLKKVYFLNIIRFKKYLAIKLVCFYLLQILINSAMCYYLMIFCTVYHKTQGSIAINYLLGIAQSMGISAGLTIIISLMRYLSLHIVGNIYIILRNIYLKTFNFVSRVCNIIIIYLQNIYKLFK